MRLSANKVVTSVEKALSMYSGFVLACTVDDAGDIHALQEEVEAKQEEQDAADPAEAQD